MADFPITHRQHRHQTVVAGAQPRLAVDVDQFQREPQLSLERPQLVAHVRAQVATGTLIQGQDGH